MRLPTPS